MPAAAEGPDTEDLKISPFARGEWSQDDRIMLDVSFTSLAAVLGDEGAITIPQSRKPGCGSLFS